MLLLLIACGVPDDPAALHGMWANTDDQARVFQFSEPTIYSIHVYEVGAEPVLVQYGTYDLDQEHLVTLPAQGGGPFSNLIVGWGGSWFELEIDKETGQTRVYDAVEDYP